MLNTKVQEFLCKHGIDLNGKVILCCVSGGADSMALLYHFISCQNVYGLSKVVACHFNHSMRGAESYRDERMVTDFCSSNDIPLIIDRLEDHFDLEHVDHSENALRKLRYQFFDNAASICGADYIATAHNMNDNVETVLFRIARGTGLRGTAGIPVMRGRLLRPLLCVSREDIEEYCSINNVQYVIDSSNLENNYKRNVIRHNIMPVLSDINTDYLDSIDNLMKISSEADNYFRTEAERMIVQDALEQGILRKTLQDAMAPLNEYIIIQLLSNRVKEITRDTVDRCLEVVASGGKIEIAEDCYFVADDHNCFFEFRYESKEIGPFSYENTQQYFPGKEFVFSDNINLDEDQIKRLFYSSVDYDKLNGVPLIRNIRDGDRFSSAYRKNTKSLKKLFNEKKYTAEQKDKILIMIDDDGLVWVEGEGPASGKEIDINTKRVIRFINMTFDGGRNGRGHC